ncbi:hypothetical protein ABRO96_21435, partial [Escherichia coli]|nr:hypothetical protein [Escherichia coli]
PVPVVPAALPENDDEDGHDIDYLEPSEVYALGRTAGWNACRAAMLHGAEPVSQAYKLNALDGNSPVTPDSWVMVPKQVTPEISNAINVVGQRCTCGNCSQRLWDLLLDATQQGG